MLLEVTIDSECTNLVTYDNQHLIMGCVNGSICYLNTHHRKIRYLVRTHNAKVIECVYQPYLKKLLTLSVDSSIKLWNIRTKLEQVYEFRSDENPITKVGSLHHKGSIICGFEDGQVKLFDLNKFFCSFTFCLIFPQVLRKSSQQIVG